MKNSEAQQKKHSTNLEEMCEGVSKTNKIRCIWKKAKNGGCFCNRHNKIMKNMEI